LDSKHVRFQRDKATPHRSTIAKKLFPKNKFNVDQIYNWPPQSPDLNPIEHMWHQLKNRLGQYPSKPHTVEELEKRINIEWYKFTKEDCLKYIDSMPGRIEAVIKSKGQQTNY
jgi:transposase